jgi:uncharacterized protein (TIGR02145 family)
MKTMKSFLSTAGISLALAFTFSGCSSDDGNEDSGGSCNIEDYKTVEIGTQIWTAENLNCNVSGSVCYDNDLANCAKYGRLYDWATALTICPSGWHLPTSEEWGVLLNYVLTNYSGGSGSIAAELKATSGWNDDYDSRSGGTDDYGFAALPGGYGGPDGNFYDAGSLGIWWSSTERDADRARSLLIKENSEADQNSGVKGALASVRCVKDDD